MTKSSNILLTSLFLLVLLTFFGFSAASANLDAALVANTVPTRTPPPQPTQPKEEPKEEPKNDNNNNDPQPTAVPPTATPMPVTLAPTPINGFVNPTRCGEPFFVATLGTINVRSEPNTESDILSTMVYLEARQVLGRWDGGAWWLILQPDTTSGWVFDETGSMIGVMESVPIISADGSGSANEPAWVPTPDLECPTVTPTAIPTEEPTATATAEPTATETPRPTAAQKTVLPDPEEEEEKEPTATVTIDPNVISALPQTDDSPIEASNIVDRESTQKQESPSAVTGSQIDEVSPSGISWPIIVGIILIIFGIGTLAFQTRREKAD